MFHDDPLLGELTNLLPERFLYEIEAPTHSKNGNGRRP